MDGRFYHFTPAFLIGSDVHVQQGPFAPWALPTSSLLRTWPSPSRLSSTSRLRQLYDGVAPSISRWGEDGFSSCSACPCHRAVPNHPAGVARRISQLASRHVAFA